MTVKDKITKAVTDKGFEVESIEWTPLRSDGYGDKEGGWTVYIAENETKVLRGCDNPLCGSTKAVLNEIQSMYVGYDFCPNCGCGISHREERAMFCENCRTNFSDTL